MKQPDLQGVLPNAPSISLPKGGGAIKNIGEKFQASPLTGTASFEVPIKVSPGRNDFGPKLSLTYDSGNGNSTYGLGWGIGIPSITRKTQKGIPKYDDIHEYDTFIFSGAEDLVPLLVKSGDDWVRCHDTYDDYSITRYRPRIEGLFARIERWYHKNERRSHWRVTTKDNLTSIFGQSQSACIQDSNNSTKIFQWFLEKTYDDKGNCMVYEYKQEDRENLPVTLSEKHRNTGLSSFSNTYLKHIKYGNTVPVNKLNGEVSVDNQWLFELVLDYGEHGDEVPFYEELNSWPCRLDPQSVYHSGFEIRTYRLCKRLLMYHHFEELGVAPYLVASTNLTHTQTPTATFLTSAQHWAFKKGKEPAPFPPISFEYSKLSKGTNEKLEIGFEEKSIAWDAQKSSWTDLYGEGIPGILYRDEGAWWYKANKTNQQVEFEGFKPVVNTPSFHQQSQLMDVDGDGKLELVIKENGIEGYFDQNNGAWENFKTFKKAPSINWEDPNLRMIDLTGDGLADLLITEDQCIMWYASLRKEGYDDAIRLPQTLEDSGEPYFVFNDQLQSIYLADMSGDGLTDVVRIKNSSICYWPNLGYGRFGDKIEISNSPIFDFEDHFDQKRIKLADIDGSGTTDILYIHETEIKYYINQSGNSFSDGFSLTNSLQFDSLSQVEVMDIFGKGTSCLVVTQTTPGIQGKLQIIDLMKEGKPYLLKEVNNNMGALTHFHYCSSTKFYLEAEKKGKPWITKLPFPVQVLEKTEVIDEIENNRFTTRYAYHHGYYDGEEREFRGFGLVEQWDTETYEEHLKLQDNKIEEELYVPPVYTKAWFHTGFYRDKANMLNQYRKEYYQGDEEAWALTEINEQEFAPNELREAARALKGSILRQEVYALDGSEKEQHPYSVAQSNYTLRKVQPKSINQFAVFQTNPAETLTYHYERNPVDPRIAHEMVLAVDEFGNMLRSATIAYPRRQPEFKEQAKHGVVINENEFINVVEDEDFYRIGVSYETKVFELTGMSFDQKKFNPQEIDKSFLQAADLAFENKADLAILQRRLLDHQKVTFYSEDLQSELELGRVAFHAIPYQATQKAFTPGLLEKAYQGKVTVALLNETGYLQQDGDWWTPSGRVEVNQDQFYQLIRFIDEAGNVSSIEYDPYRLFPVKTTNALGIFTTSEYDYRVLQANRVVDPNLNYQLVKFDVRGSVMATAIGGKNGEGDTLDDPTSKSEYELFNWFDHKKPNYSKMMARERHKDSATPWQMSYTYTNGAGKEILTKVQAEDGEAFYRDNNGALVKDGDGRPKKRVSTDRWIGNGRVVLNNKGKPVKQYEPYFSDNPNYEDEEEIREYGVTPVNHYDPLERVIRTDMPDGTFIKVKFDPWQKTSWDQNDLVLESDWFQQSGAPNPDGAQPSEPRERAAWLAAQHANTPQQVLLDYLGRDIVTIEDNGNDGKYKTQIELDIEGNQQRIIDPKGRIIATYLSDILGRQIYSWSADAGERWTLFNQFVEEAEEEGEEDQPLPAYGWDSRGFQRRIIYDPLQRPYQEWVKAAEEEKLVEWTVFAEALFNAVDLNLVGQPYLQFDQAGMQKNEGADFKGNPLSGYRQFAKEYKETIDRSSFMPVDIDQLETQLADSLEPEQFHSSSTFDALSRPITTTHPDQTIVKPTYNKANLLEKVSAQIKGEATSTDFVTNINYDEKGQRKAIYYANGTKTNYRYDPLNYRLTRLFTVRQSDNKGLQDLHYTYDPVGNITEIRDDAQQEVFFNNAQVEPSGKYVYDALYRLKIATGRELAGLGQTGSQDIPIQTIQQPNDANALRRYTQNYQYDELGNILEMKHLASNANWTRHYRYEDGSNRLTETSSSGEAKSDAYSNKYLHDEHGSMTQMLHLASIKWDMNDQMREVDLGGGGKAYYVYDSGGQRIRKVIERNGGKIQERLYLGEVEVYRERLGDTLQLERETFHISDDETRIAQIDTKTRDVTSPPQGETERGIRYQLSNHLGSATLELDENASIISYEEYHPFGSSAYRSGRSESEVSLKRYRYSGKERDEETGLYYYGARSLIPWLGRWSSADLAGFVDGLNVFGFVKNRPFNFIDESGFQSKQAINKLNYKKNEKVVQSKRNSIVKYKSKVIEKKIAKQINAHKTYLQKWLNPQTSYIKTKKIQGHYASNVRNMSRSGRITYGAAAVIQAIGKILHKYGVYRNKKKISEYRKGLYSKTANKLRKQYSDDLKANPLTEISPEKIRRDILINRGDFFGNKMTQRGWTAAVYQGLSDEEMDTLYLELSRLVVQAKLDYSEAGLDQKKYDQIQKNREIKFLEQLKKLENMDSMNFLHLNSPIIRDLNKCYVE